MGSYDQWKTASPWDDAVDWNDEYGVVCPKCDHYGMEDTEIYGNSVSFLCDDCGHEWVQILDILPEGITVDEPSISIFDELEDADVK